MAQNTGKSDFFFCIISTALAETGGGGAIALFHRKTLQVCFMKIRILQAAVPVLCWYFFNLNEKRVVKKEIFFRF